LLSSRFDAEGLPAKRIEIIKDGKLATFSTSQKYADYLSIPATGDFGAPEVPAGKTALKDLLTEPYIEVSMFSWFNPDSISGDFATEIRLGYLVKDGKATPFKGGQLIGNVLTALSDCHWSSETGFFGTYTGPVAVRFNKLKVAST
jgi:predicted Zn-dependent protease